MARRPDSEVARAAKRELGRKICALREAAGLTQLQLAQELERITGAPCSVKTVATWENQNREPPVAPAASLYPSLAQALRCSQEQLFSASAKARAGNPLEIATHRLARKLGPTRFQELSVIPEKRLREAADQLISAHKDARDQLDAAANDGEDS